MQVANSSENQSVKDYDNTYGTDLNARISQAQQLIALVINDSPVEYGRNAKSARLAGKTISDEIRLRLQNSFTKNIQIR